MATQKPSKPDVTLPNNFGGVKTPYTQAQIDNGYQEAVPEIVDGGNINYEKDALFQKLKYLESIADTVNNIPVGKFLVVNSNNQFEYADASAKSSFGNIGDIQYTASTEVPLGGAWCDGALYTKAQFPDVYQMLVDGKLKSTTVSEFDSSVSANGSCGFFGLDTSNERFKVPMLKDVYLKAGQTPSMFGAESLPNIKGTIGAPYYISLGVDDGAFYEVEPDTNMKIPGGSEYRVYKHKFNASRYDARYKDSAKVNPDHIVYRAYVVLYSSAAEASEAQAAEFINTVTDLRSELAHKKEIGYEHVREIAVSGNTTVAIQDTDEIISLPVSAKATITFDTSALTFPEFFYTVQIRVYFTSGVKTVTLAKSGGSINWVNANAPSFASGKPHWLTLRIGQTWSFVLMSDAGEEG